jgi:monoamine oxidase
LSDPLGFRDAAGLQVGKVYSAVQDFPMQNTMFQPVGGMDAIATAFEKRVGRFIRYKRRSADHPPRRQGTSPCTRTPAAASCQSLSADYCLCAIPLSVLRMIDTDFSDKFKAAVKAVSYAPVGKIGLQMKRRFWEEDDHIYGGHVFTDLKASTDLGAVLPAGRKEGRAARLLQLPDLDAIEVSA